MDKKESLIVKGFAASSMVFMHLFNQMGNVNLCENFISIDGMPLVYLLSIPSIRVALYLFMSGYGLYCSFDKDKIGRGKTKQRVLLLYARFWIIFCVFIGIGVILFSPSYLKSPSVFIGNITGFDTTYNGEWWFLFPYIMLVITSKFIFRVVDRYNPLLIIGAVGAIFLSAYTMCKLNGEFLYSNHFVYQPLLYCTSLFSFVIGALSAKYNVFVVIRKRLQLLNANLVQTLFIVLPLICLGVRIFYIPFGVFDSLLAFVILFAIVLMRRYKWIDSILTIIGKQSTNIWLIHSFFFYYFWHDFFYSLKYPVLIFIVVMLLSYTSGKLLDLIYAPVQRYIKSKL